MDGLILSQNTCWKQWIGSNMSSFSGVKSGGWELPQPEVNAAQKSNRYLEKNLIEFCENFLLEFLNFAAADLNIVLLWKQSSGNLRWKNIYTYILTIKVSVHLQFLFWHPWKRGIYGLRLIDSVQLTTSWDQQPSIELHTVSLCWNNIHTRFPYVKIGSRL